MIENDELILDRYSIVLLVLMTLFLAPVAMTVGGVMLFNDNTYKQDTGKLLVTGAFCSDAYSHHYSVCRFGDIDD
ncbi:hypothetical protein [Paenibacillus sp. OK003]|uniref:hypothetical protein n=1 Tax=Paenibacillus sp. OK003 TaxID=1884380 RepID=UPI0008CE53DC|nr:hypothetical protein [Paenibacillus sp. OK003]SEK19465.1 hypothetical protein SAMN05518856_10116 [Paenibacillus sp. OK003]